MVDTGKKGEVEIEGRLKLETSKEGGEGFGYGRYPEVHIGDVYWIGKLFKIQNAGQSKDEVGEGFASFFVLGSKLNNFDGLNSCWVIEELDFLLEGFGKLRNLWAVLFPHRIMLSLYDLSTDKPQHRTSPHHHSITI